MQPPPGGKGGVVGPPPPPAVGKGAQPAHVVGKAAGVAANVIHIPGEEDSDSDNDGPGPVMANVPPVGQGTWARIDSMCDDDWEADFMKHESGPKQRDPARERAEAKALFEAGKLSEEECVALVRMSKVEIKDIAKPSKAHTAQLTAGLRTSSKGKTYLSDAFFKQILSTWGGQIFLLRWPDVKSRASQEALLVAWWNLSRDGVEACDEKTVLFPRTIEHQTKHECLDLVKTIISLRERQQIDILISPISRKYPFNTLKLTRGIHHLAAHDCAVLAQEDWNAIINKDYRFTSIKDYMIDATPPILNAIYLAGVMEIAESIRTHTDRTRAAFANTTVPFETVLDNTITIQTNWKISARSLTEAFVRALFDTPTNAPIFVNDPRLMQRNIVQAWEEGLRGVAKNVDITEFLSVAGEYGGGPAVPRHAAATRSTPYETNDWGKGGWKYNNAGEGGWKPKKAGAAATFAMMRNIKSAIGCDFEQLCCPFGMECSYKTTNCKWNHDPAVANSFKIKDPSLPEEDIIKKAKEFLNL